MRTWTTRRLLHVLAAGSVSACESLLVMVWVMLTGGSESGHWDAALAVTGPGAGDAAARADAALAPVALPASPIQFRQPLSWVIRSCAARVPIAVGRNATVTMHFPPPGAIGCARQVSPATLKSPGVGPTMSRLRMTIAPSPPLTIVIGRSAEPPTGTKSNRTNSVVVHSSGVPVCACPVRGVRRGCDDRGACAEQERQA